MKKLFIGVLVTASLFLGTATNLSPVNQQIFAQTGSTNTTPGSNSSDQEIQLNFGTVAKEKGVAGTTNYNPENGNAGFGLLLTQILNIIATIAGIILLIMLLWGGVEWITSGGDKGKTEKARNRITQSVIGMIVLSATMAIFFLLQKTLNFSIFTDQASRETTVNTQTQQNNTQPGNITYPQGQNRPGGIFE